VVLNEDGSIMGGDAEALQDPFGWTAEHCAELLGMDVPDAHGRGRA
jgi:hypothetical protein